MAQDAPRLREAAYKCCGLLSELWTAAGDPAANVEDLAPGTQLHQAAPILERLETIIRELLAQVNGLSVEPLQHLAGAARGPDRTGSP